MVGAGTLYQIMNRFFTGKAIIFNGTTYDVQLLSRSSAETVVRHDGKVYLLDGERLVTGPKKSIELLAKEMGTGFRVWGWQP